MKGVILFFLFSRGISCPVGYTDGGDGSCYLWKGTPEFLSRNEAYHTCAKNNAYIPDISSSGANTDLISNAEHTTLWLGLTCLWNSVESCVWDNGRAVNSDSYNNFEGGSPNIEHGPCAYIDVSTGKWHSADCSNVDVGYACKYTPNINIPYCDFGDDYPDCGTFRGKCYRILDARNIEEAAFRCAAYNSVQTSIHSDGENAFISGLVVNYAGFYSLLFLGIQNNGTWVDTTIIDYTNYDYIRPMDKCMSLVVDDRGKWITSPCSAANAVTVCTKESSTPLTTFPTSLPIPGNTTGNSSSLLSESTTAPTLEPTEGPRTSAWPVGSSSAPQIKAKTASNPPGFQFYPLLLIFLGMLLRR